MIFNLGPGVPISIRHSEPTAFARKQRYNHLQINNDKRYLITMMRFKVKSMWWVKEIVISLNI